jgi:serine kinase of HPr protein (carbohydrate metabolism regulator)
MEEDIIQNARAYASKHHLKLAERLGFGVHGIIFVTEDKSIGGKTAIKAHREIEPYRREHAVYERLEKARVSEILGFNVPQLIRADDDLRVIEMTIVARPFLLDFAGGVLGQAPGLYRRDLGSVGI